MYAAFAEEAFLSAPPASDSTEWTGSLVLVIDDHPAACDLMTRSLALESFLDETATVAADGQRRAQDITPDTILLDLVMPNIHRWEVLAALRSDPYLAEIPVIMTTGVEEKDRAFAWHRRLFAQTIDCRYLVEMLQQYHPTSYELGIAAESEPVYEGVNHEHPIS